jgi:hypothetical protein
MTLLPPFLKENTRPGKGLAPAGGEAKCKPQSEDKAAGYASFHQSQTEIAAVLRFEVKSNIYELDMHDISIEKLANQIVFSYGRVWRNCKNSKRI